MTNALRGHSPRVEAGRSASCGLVPARLRAGAVWRALWPILRGQRSSAPPPLAACLKPRPCRLRALSRCLCRPFALVGCGAPLSGALWLCCAFASRRPVGCAIPRLGRSLLCADKPAARAALYAIAPGPHCAATRCPCRRSALRDTGCISNSVPAGVLGAL